jgi:hypothetical protein
LLIEHKLSLTSEDTLKLNVLLHSDVEAIRIDESRMTVHALSGDSESQVSLNPDCKPEQYIKQVREMLSGHVLGSPGGYPVFLKRWTRMGQARDEGLNELLMLGEPEAVVAVANAPGLTDELARRAWWADPVSENARRMLERSAVVEGAMGKILAQHLVEHLAFETEPQVMMDTIRLILQPGLIDEATRHKVWASGARKNAYRVGFLQATPDALPEPKPGRNDLEQVVASLQPLVEDGNVIAHTLIKTLRSEGQTFLSATESILRKPANQDVVVALLNSLGSYFAPARQLPHHAQDIDALIAETRAICDGDHCEALAQVLAVAPSARSEAEALLILSRVNEFLVTPIFAKTTAEGTLMRRKIGSVTAPIFERIATLLGKDAGASP